MALYLPPIKNMQKEMTHTINIFELKKAEACSRFIL